MLMRSMYDLVHEDDVIGLQAIKKYFWDRGQPSVEAYIRRQTLPADSDDNMHYDDSPCWIWLAVKVAAYLDMPIPGAVLHEQVVHDTNVAMLISKTSRVVAIILAAVEQAASNNKDAASATGQPLNNLLPDVASLMGHANALNFMQSFRNNRDDRSYPDISSTLAPGFASVEEGGTATADNNSAAAKSLTRTPSLLEMVRSRETLDLSRIPLSIADLKMVAYILTSRISTDDLRMVVLTAFNSPSRDLSAAISAHVQPSNKDNNITEHQQHGERKTTPQSFVSVTEVPQQQPDEVMKPRNFFQRFNTSTTDLLPRSISDRGRILFNAVPSSAAVAATTITSPSIEPAQQQKPKRFLQRSTSQRKRSIETSETTDTCGLRAPLSYTSIPKIGVLNLSYTFIGCHGVEFLCEELLSDNPFIKTLDISFCLVEDRGILALSKALNRRKINLLPQIEGLVISGNFLSYRGAKELGMALSTANPSSRSTSSHSSTKTASREKTSLRASEVDTDDTWDDGDDLGDESDLGTKSGNGCHWRRPSRETKRPIRQHLTSSSSKNGGNNGEADLKNNGLLLLHAACASMTPESLRQLLRGLGPDCPIRELCIASNNLGSSGASELMEFLEGKDIFKYKKGQPVMPFLDRIDMSNNNLDNDGATKITRAISKRPSDFNLVELRLSSNEIGHLGVETLMNKLLNQNLFNLYLDNNDIGDRGCQLVAASLPCMHHLRRLYLNFNQIGSRGINALMRSLVGCESLEHLALSGNIIKISGSSAMGFALSQHPRLCSLELENCCLSQAAQCHITAGIISNRWVPMKSLVGYLVGPPMVAIGALDVVAQQLSNEECFRIRRDMQMKVIVDWMESNKSNQAAMNDEEKIANSLQLSQSAYHRMLDWLGRIPFDEDELSDLRSYFYDADGGDNERTSDGNINLRLRGDLLAALGSEIVDEIREEPIYLLLPSKDVNSNGLYMSESENEFNDEENECSPVWNSLARCSAITSHCDKNEESTKLRTSQQETIQVDQHDVGESVLPRPLSYTTGSEQSRRRKRCAIEFPNARDFRQSKNSFSEDHSKNSQTTMKSASKGSTCSSIDDELNSDHRRGKARIYMFRPFAEKLELLKLHAQEMMDHEPDAYQQDIIAQQFAEASLTLLRQLRYHCMNNGLDGWRQGKIRRKILIVDDSVVTRKMVSRAFEKANFVVDTAANGEEGVAKLKESIYDIAFMDIDMPVMNGFDATKALREWEDIYRPGARQPICALTAAYVDDFERSELMKFKEAGLDVMESKPCNIPRLFKVVDDVSPMFSDLSITVTHMNP